MALVVVWEKDSISTDCGTLTYDDVTGNYSASNLTGYGAPNPARSVLYQKIIVALEKTTGRELMTLPSYTANTVSTIDVDITEDGNYNLYVFATYAWEPATARVVGNVVFFLNDSKWYRCIQAYTPTAPLYSDTKIPGVDTAYWTQIAADADVDYFIAAIDSGQVDAYYSNTNHIELCASNKCFAKAVKKAVGCACASGCACTEDYEKIRAKIEGAQVYEAEGSYSSAQEIVENLQDVCNCYGEED